MLINPYCIRLFRHCRNTLPILERTNLLGIMNRGGFRGGRGRGRGRPERSEDGNEGPPREGPPPHLKGREIGLWYARRQGKKAKEQEVIDAAEIRVDEELSRRLTSLSTALDRSLNSSDSSNNCSFATVLDEINNPRPRPNRIINPELKRDQEIDASLLKDFSQLKDNSQYKKMFDFRMKLPSANAKDEILKSIHSSQVVVVSGETGCGKTTQIGQYILDDMIMQGNGSLCNILCTQPRRISAVSVAERVAEERCERIGSKSVGYVIRLESKKPQRESGTLVFCTTGVVLQYLKSDPYLQKYSHIMVDEVHERDSNSDILISILKDLLPIRPDLKVILMSATINAEHFSEYFGNCPMFKIEGLTFPVTEYYLEDIIEHLRFEFKNQVEDDRIFGRKRNLKRWPEEYKKYLSDYIRRSLRDRKKYSQTTISEIMKPESEEFESLVLLSARILEEISSADRDNGAVLIFVTGWDEISKLHNHLSSCGKFPENKFIICPLHSMMPTINQRKIFDRPPPGMRKIIISTNIAETSVTIDDVVHVIDFGKIKTTDFDKDRDIHTLDSNWVSRANTKQRKGRAGRVQEGYCYHLFTKSRESTFEDFLKPEIQRKRLEEVILQLKLLKLGPIKTRVFPKLLDPPERKVVDLSYDRLVLLNALDEDENLTPLGYHLSCLPMDPASGKMILMGAVFSVLDPVLSVAAALSFKDPFYLPLGKEKIVDRIRQSMAEGSKSDHWVTVNAIDGYERAKLRGTERDYCFQNFLSLSTCKLLVDSKKSFCEQLHRMQFLSTINYKDSGANINSSNIALVKAVICCGLYPNVAKLRGRKSNNGPPFPVLRTVENERVTIHPKSVNASETDFESPLVIYHLKKKLKNIVLFDTTMVSPYPLIFFGGKLQHQVILNTSLMVIDNSFKFKISKANFETIQALRLSLDKILAMKVQNPSPTDWDSTHLEGQLLIAIRDLITTEYHHIMNPDDFSDEDE